MRETEGKGDKMVTYDQTEQGRKMDYIIQLVTDFNIQFDTINIELKIKNKVIK